MDKIIALYGGANVGKSTTFMELATYAKEFEPHAPIEWIRKWRSSKEDCKGMAENILKKWV